MKALRLVALCLLASLGPDAGVMADDGIWLFNQVPKERIRKKYGFQVSDQFLDHLRLSSVRTGTASGSFVSPNGLIFTNHHVASDCIQKVSTARNDYMANGFYAASAAEEKRCPDLEVNVLLRIEDVTAKVNEGIGAGTPGAQANETRKANTARIEKACSTAAGNRCDVVTLYSGGQYHLYEYKKYTDVRLVFAPEAGIAFFGGDPDNFTYPRYDLDIAFFRAYENGKPAQTRHYLKWSREGVKEGELAFVSGHPGSTGRLLTMAQLEFSRDVSYPLIHRRLEQLIRAVKAFGARSAENARVARDTLFSAENSYKAYSGFLVGLRDKGLMDRKRQDEQKLRAAVSRDAKLRAAYGKVWDEIAAAYKEYRTFYTRYRLLESDAMRASDLFAHARRLLRLAEEKAKPNERRLKEYRDSALPSLEQQLFSTAPISNSLETAVIAESFRFMQQELGAADPLVKAILSGRTPEQAAGQYVAASKLGDVAERKRLAANSSATASSQDGMLRLARMFDGEARKLRKRYEDRVEAVEAVSAAGVARARFAVLGAEDYPDATSTLRLSYGPVAGYKDNSGKPVPYATTFDGLYRKATGVDPYKLPPSWVKAKNALNPRTPFNFVTTADTHGGNSGSPTVNTKGEVIGILFDGNIESLPARFVYTDEQSRSVHVASQAVIEALRKVYKADRVLKELGM